MKKEKNEQIVYNPHDAVFRATFRDLKAAKNYFRHHLPKELTRHIDFRTLKIMDGTYVDEKLKDRHSLTRISINIHHRRLNCLRSQ